MSALGHTILLQWKLNYRSKEVLIHFYIVPLLFYVFIGNIFVSLNPSSVSSIVYSMSIFGICMGGILGYPYPLVEIFASDIRKAYKAAHIPLGAIVWSHVISGVIHLFLLSMIIYITSPIIFNTSLDLDLAKFMLTSIVLIIANVSIGSVFGLCVKSVSKLSLLTQLVFLPSIMLSGIMFPTSMLPVLFQRLGYILPATWGYSLLTTGDSVGFVVLIGISVVMFGVCWWRVNRV
ncbi:MAG: ABC transporter permease [Erysipelotrichales bacterium]|nr:ABC transporter permease [Erysipelotrichales bacterium]